MILMADSACLAPNRLHMPPPVAKNHRFRLQSMRYIRLCQFCPAPTPAPVTLACMIAPELPRPTHTVVLIA